MLFLNHTVFAAVYSCSLNCKLRKLEQRNHIYINDSLPCLLVIKVMEN